MQIVIVVVVSMEGVCMEGAQEGESWRIYSPARSFCFCHEFRATARLHSGLSLVSDLRVRDLLQSHVRVFLAPDAAHADNHEVSYTWTLMITSVMLSLSTPILFISPKCVSLISSLYRGVYSGVEYRQTRGTRS